MREKMFVEKKGDRPNVANIVILMTDGVSNIDKHDTIPQAERARADKIRVFVIGIGLKENTDEIDAIASRPVSQNRFIVNSFTELNNIRQKITGVICDGKIMHSFSVDSNAKAGLQSLVLLHGNQNIMQGL